MGRANAISSIMMVYKMSLVCCCLFFTVVASSQNTSDEWSSGDTKNLETIKSAITFFREAETPIIRFDTFTSSNKILVYDSFLTKYYDLSYLEDSVKDRLNNFESRVGTQKLILYNADLFLDILPDSLFTIFPIRFSEMAESSKYFPKSTFVISFLIENVPYSVFVIAFSEGGKIYMVSPLIDFESSDSKRSKLEKFYQNLKGYKVIEPNLWRP